MFNVKKLPLLLLLCSAFVLHSCKSSTEPDDNNNNNNGTTGKLTVGSSYTNEAYTTGPDFEPAGSPTTYTNTIESTTANYQGRSNVIVSANSVQTTVKGYQVIESNGDFSMYTPIVGGPGGILYSKWVRFPTSGSGQTDVVIDTMVTFAPGFESHVTGNWTVKALGPATYTANGKTWNVQMVELRQTTNWDIQGMTMGMVAVSKYYWSPELTMPVRSDVMSTQVQMGFEQSTYQTVRLKSYEIN
jgi:hypothetical protein